MTAEATQRAMSLWPFWERGCGTRVVFGFPAPGMERYTQQASTLPPEPHPRPPRGNFEVDVSLQMGGLRRERAVPGQEEGCRSLEAGGSSGRDKGLGKTSNYSLCERR